ncbi:MAG: TylF/MycF/NovP-related O-methyltransferase, partial [Opitutales bacterium]
TEEERNMMVLVVASPRAKVIHEIALALVSDERTVDLPLEYAVAPKRENEQIDHMWENSADFVSPLHVQSIDCFALFRESLEKFDPKTGIRDFLDLVQCVNHVVANEVTGDFAEFGSFKGQSGYLLGRYLEEIECDKRLFLFDAFESFPRESIGIDHFWSETHKVDYNEVQSKFTDLPHVSLVRGDFTQTLPQSECGKLALAFVDCDSFRGTKYLIEDIFDKRLSHGGLMIFEDYGHAGLLGNRLAVHEAFEGKPGTFRFFSQFSGSFVVCKTGTYQL